MRITYQVGADSRHDQGKGASRRLRRAGKVPAVIYGGQGGPRFRQALQELARLVPVDVEAEHFTVDQAQRDIRGLHESELDPDMVEAVAQTR